MAATNLNFFSQTRASEFWREHRIGVDHDTLVYEARTNPESQRPMSLETQMRTRRYVAVALKNQPNTVALDALVIASGNVMAFNLAFPKLAKLEHPALLTRGPVVLSLRQLAYEFQQVERASILDAQDESARFSPLPPVVSPQKSEDFNTYTSRARSRLAGDNARLLYKYAHIAHVARAAGKHAEIARDVAQRHGMQILEQPHKQALGELHTAVRRSLSAAKTDLFVLEDFYNRAAQGAQALAGTSFENIDTASKKDGEEQAVDFPIAPLRLPNLFGPGEMVLNTAHTAKRMQDLFDNTFEIIDHLRMDVLRPRASELAYVDATLRALLVYRSSVPKLLGPMGNGRIFERDPQR